MKKVKRVGIFETNSSSTHSICIVDGPLEDTLTSDNGTITLSSGEFGWEVQDYWDADTKASYLFTDCWVSQPYNKDTIEMYAECQRQDKLDMLISAIEDHTGLKVETQKFDDDFYPYGYIDHQSRGICNEVWQSPENLKNFIFNSKCLLSTDNDNH